MQRIGICGLGLIGRQRLAALHSLGWKQSQIIAFDPQFTFQDSGKFEPAKSIDEILASEVDSVIIATPHDIAPDLTLKFLDTGVRDLFKKRNRSYKKVNWEIFIQ